MTPFMHGSFSYLAGSPLKANPYYCGTPREETEWVAGWLKAQDEAAQA